MNLGGTRPEPLVGRHYQHSDQGRTELSQIDMVTSSNSQGRLVINGAKEYEIQET